MNIKCICKTLSIAAMMGLYLASPALAGDIKGTVKPQGLRSAKNILVYVDKAPAAKGADEHKYVMDQQNLAFIPHILPISVGDTVDFPNRDKVDHNVFSLSKAKKFNLGSYKPGQSKTVIFDQPGVVELRCDVHQEMNAYILVLKNPYFAVTAKDSSYTIKDLPAGKYRVKTWHEKLRTAKAKVEVPESGAAELNLKPKRGPAGVLYKR